MPIEEQAEMRLGAMNSKLGQIEERVERLERDVVYYQDRVGALHTAVQNIGTGTQEGGHFGPTLGMGSKPADAMGPNAGPTEANLPAADIPEETDKLGRPAPQPQPNSGANSEGDASDPRASQSDLPKPKEPNAPSSDEKPAGVGPEKTNPTAGTPRPGGLPPKK